MPCQQRLPGIQVELRHAATHVQPCTSPQICRTATQHQLTAAVSPVASRCLERQRGKVAVLDHVAPRLVAQGHPKTGVAALAGRLAERRRQLERRPQQRGIDLQLAGLAADIQPQLIRQLARGRQRTFAAQPGEQRLQRHLAISLDPRRRVLGAARCRRLAAYRAAQGPRLNVRGAEAARRVVAEAAAHLLEPQIRLGNPQRSAGAGEIHYHMGPLAAAQGNVQIQGAAERSPGRPSGKYLRGTDRRDLQQAEPIDQCPVDRSLDR